MWTQTWRKQESQPNRYLGEGCHRQREQLEQESRGWNMWEYSGKSKVARVAGVEWTQGQSHEGRSVRKQGPHSLTLHTQPPRTTWVPGKPCCLLSAYIRTSCSLYSGCPPQLFLATPSYLLVLAKMPLPEGGPPPSCTPAALQTSFLLIFTTELWLFQPYILHRTVLACLQLSPQGLVQSWARIGWPKMIFWKNQWSEWVNEWMYPHRELWVIWGKW